LPEEQPPQAPQAPQPSEGARGSREGRGGRGSRDSRDSRGRRDRRDSANAEGREREFLETVVKVLRSSTVVKGGRRFSFAALVVVGDGKGRVGIGYGKANEVPPAVEKAMKVARVGLQRIHLVGDTIPHPVEGRYGSARILLRPAGAGTGVIAGASVRAVLEAVGVKNVLSKCFGSRNPKNVVKATMNALTLLRTKALVESLRGVTIE
jgi:small subunit ribosomal protein S5